MIHITEIFYSLQGEGSRTGTPSVFIRTALCNFTCAGFNVQYNHDDTIKYGCDSYKAVDKLYKDSWKRYEDYNDIVKDVLAVIPQFKRIQNTTKVDIVLTGGEPLIHWNNPIYQNLIQYFSSRGHTITIETNGSLDIKFEYPYQRDIIFSTSVKLPASHEPKEKRINHKSLYNIFTNTKNSYLKFVTSLKSWKEDVYEIEEVIDKLPKFVRVYLMPLGSNNTELLENSVFIFEKAMQYGLLYSDRVHIRVYDDKEGV